MIFEDILTVFWRDWRVLKRRLGKFILSRMVAPMLYLVAFGWGLGRSIETAGGSYLNFIVPGILALNSMNISFGSIMPLHAERVYHKSLDEYILAPVSPSAFIVGKILSAVLRGLISSAIIMALAFLFGANISIGLPLILILALNCVIFAQIGFFAAMKINTYEEMAQVNTYVLLPMSFLCGTFFLTAALPAGARFIIDLLPLTHTSSLLRSLCSGGEIAPLSLAVLLFYAALGFWLDKRAFAAMDA